MNGMEQLQRIVEMQKSASATLSPGMEKQASWVVNGLIRGLTRINPAKAGLTGKNLGWGTRMWNQLKAVPANALVDVQNILIDPWLALLQKGGRLIHGKQGVKGNSFYRYLTQQRRDIQNNVRRVQRHNNFSTGHGAKTNLELKQGYDGTYSANPNGDIRFNRTIAEEVKDADGKVIGNKLLENASPDPRFKDPTTGRLRMTGEIKDEAGNVIGSKFVKAKPGDNPNWDLSRQLLRFGPGTATVIGMGAAGERMSESSNPWVAGAGKALYYSDPWLAVPTAATAPIKWGTEAVSPWLKEYYRSKYYDTPPNLLGHLYKTFNPSGYSDHLKTEVDRKMNDYLSGRSGAAILRDMFTGKVGDSSTPKEFF